MKNKILFTFIFMIFSLNSNYSIESNFQTNSDNDYNLSYATDRIANFNGYFKLKLELKKKSLNFLIHIDDLKNKYKNTLKQMNKYYQAKEISQDFSNLYNNTEKTFNAIFEYLDSELINEGDKLDLSNSPLQTKLMLINRLKDQAYKYINDIIVKAEKEINRIKNINY